MRIAIQRKQPDHFIAESVCAQPNDDIFLTIYTNLRECYSFAKIGVTPYKYLSFLRLAAT